MNDIEVNKRTGYYDWIEYAKQRPTKEDADKHGLLQIGWPNEKVLTIDWFAISSFLELPTHWRRIEPTPKIEPSKPRESPKYTAAEIKERIGLMSGCNLHFSNQYGILFVLNDDAETKP